MAQPTTTFLDELVAAARGCVALVVGNRQAPTFFDFRQAGLVGSFIALVIGLAVQAFGPPLLGTPAPAGVASTVVILGAVVAGIQFGVAYVVLRQFGRGDGFVPFVVVQNWATMFQGILAVAMIAIFGEPLAMEPGGEMARLTTGSIPFVALGIAAFVISINIARLILTLRPLHVALFVIAQLATAFVMQPLLGALL
ncbi:hypothetical protein [Devosia sp.]|uniref:hypothetical protein n=1 Tax=Devosia sp. TaxID=1871048 RepID=UPI002FC657D8